MYTLTHTHTQTCSLTHTHTHTHILSLHVVLGSEVVSGSSSVITNAPVLGLYSAPGEGGGRVVVYGDSNCLDSAHMQRDCFWLLDTLLKYATSSVSPPPFTASEQVRVQPTALPQHMDGEGS